MLDRAEKELAVGDIVAYAVLQHRSAKLLTGELVDTRLKKWNNQASITEVKIKPFDDYRKAVWRRSTDCVKINKES